MSEHVGKMVHGSGSPRGREKWTKGMKKDGYRSGSLWFVTTHVQELWKMLIRFRLKASTICRDTHP